MFVSFMGDDKPNRGGMVVPALFTVHRSFMTNLTALTKYYRTHEFYLPNNHLIKELILNLGVSGETNLLEYVDAVRDRIATLSTMYKLSSIHRRGQVLERSQFLNDRVQEIVILHGEPFDIEACATNWQELEAVKFLDHPHTDISFAIPDGTYKSDEMGAAVISINLPLLALQYRLWAQQELLKDNPSKVSTFIVGYVLNNAIRSHTDIAISNRLFNHVSKTPNLNKKKWRSTSLGLPDYTASIDNILETYTTLVTRKQPTFWDILHNIPTLTGVNFTYRAQLPNIITTNSVAWAMYAAVIKKLVLAFRITSERGMFINQQVINEVSWITKRLDNNKVFTQQYPAELLELYDELQDRVRSRQ